MGLRSSAVKAALLLFSLLGSLAAGPKLRLSTNTIGPISIAVGSNGGFVQIEAFNDGDSGQLNPVPSTSVNWLRAVQGATQACEWAGRPGFCILIVIWLDTASLPKGLATGEVTVHDPNAADSPQVVTVMAAMGGGLPDKIELWAAANHPPATATMTSTDFLPLSYSPTSLWLKVTGAVTGTLKPGVAQGITYTVTAQPPGGAESDYNDIITSRSSTFPPDDKRIPVTFHVNNHQPIADASPARMRFRVAEGQPATQKGVITITERGAVPLAVTGVSTAGGAWLKAGPAGLTTEVTADAAGLARGVYQGSVTITSNAVNGPLVVPVELSVVPQSVPLPNYRGAVNIGTYLAEDGAAPGEIMAVFGEQLAFGEPREAGAVPLPRQIVTTRVLVNGLAAPLFYISYGQVNFQLPWETPVGEALVQVERDGQLSGPITVRVEERTPHLRKIGEYGVIQNFTLGNALPMPPTPGVNARRARAGDILVIYASGLGATNPSAPTGGIPPAGPLARLTVPVTVHFVDGAVDVTAVPDFAGLAPTLVGTNQINVAIPANAPKGDRVQLWLELGGQRISNTVLVAIE